MSAPRCSLRLMTLLAATLLATPTQTVLADAVDPPPASCPAGSRPTSSHAGPLCAPEPDCTASTACGAGASCMAVMQCVEQRACGGLRPPDSGPCFVSNVVGPCRTDGTCATGTCTARNVCSSGSSSSGCACSAAGTRAPTSASMLALATLALLGAAVRLARRAPRERR